MIDVATGTLPSGTRFTVSVSEPVDPDELRAIGNLLHGGATKLEATREQWNTPEARAGRDAHFLRRWGTLLRRLAG